MFVGHFGLAELGKGLRRELPLLWLAIAAYLPDLTRFVLPLFTSEREIYSHSIPAVLVMGLLIAALWKLRGGSLGGAAVLAIVCFLHWPADVFTGCKPTIPDGPWIGLVSYRHPVSDLALEGALLVTGWLLIRRGGRSFTKWWLIGGAVLQLGFLVSMYWGSELYVGHREWVWKPDSSLLPVRHSYEPTTCKAQEPE